MPTAPCSTLNFGSHLTAGSPAQVKVYPNRKPLIAFHNSSNTRPLFLCLQCDRAPGSKGNFEVRRSVCIHPNIEGSASIGIKVLQIHRKIELTKIKAKGII